MTSMIGERFGIDVKLMSVGAPLGAQRGVSSRPAVIIGAGGTGVECVRRATQMIERRIGRIETLRCLADPAAVVDAWTRAYDWRLNRGLIVQAPIGDPGRFLRRLPRLMHPRYRWALTLQAGASLVAPHTTWDRVHVYIDIPPPDRADSMHVLAAIAARAEWPPATDGRLVLMVPHYTASAWHNLRAVRGLHVVSDLQLVLDLWHYPLRGREQAEQLLGRMRGNLAPEAPPPSDAARGIPRARDAEPTPATSSDA